MPFHASFFGLMQGKIRIKTTMVGHHGMWESKQMG
jgi:hypothetical protein